MMTIFMSLFATMSYAQSGSAVTGRVIDSSGEVIIGAAVCKYP